MLKTPVEVVFLTRPVEREPKNCAHESPASAVPCTINLLASVILAEPSKLVPAMVRAVVSFAAEPVMLLVVSATVPAASGKLIARAAVAVLESVVAFTPEPMTIPPAAVVPVRTVPVIVPPPVILLPPIAIAPAIVPPASGKYVPESDGISAACSARHEAVPAPPEAG